MIEHHIQKNILDYLVAVPCARFSELKPNNIDGNIFTYHLQQLIKAGYVEKQEDGSYCLTANGKAVGINNKLRASERLHQAHSILLLAVRDTTGQWLVRKRLVHPMYGCVGFIHGEPTASENTVTTAAKVLIDKAGLAADFVALGGGYIRLFKNDDVESFTHFTLLTAVIPHDNPIAADHSGENFWYEGTDFTDPSFIPSMQALADYVVADKPFFAELEHHI